MKKIQLMRTIALLMLILSSACAYSQDKVHTIVFLNRKADADVLPKEQLDKLMEGHAIAMNKLIQEKKLSVVGRFDDGGGMLILNTASTEEARTWLKADPSVQATRWNIEVFPYLPRVGSVCPVTDDNETVAYTLIRYDIIINEYTIHEYPELIYSHDQYLKTLPTEKIVAESTFGADGNVLIMKGNINRDIIDADPAVQHELTEVMARKLWVIKGSFCEK